MNFLIDNTPTNKSTGEPRSRWKDDIKIKLDYNGRVYIGLIWPRMGTNEGQ